jgi:hypothetical protein
MVVTGSYQCAALRSPPTRSANSRAAWYKFGNRKSRHDRPKPRDCQVMPRPRWPLSSITPPPTVAPLHARSSISGNLQVLLPAFRGCNSVFEYESEGLTPTVSPTGNDNDRSCFTEFFPLPDREFTARQIPGSSHSSNPRTLGTFTGTDVSGNPFSTSHSLWAAGNLV